MAVGASETFLGLDIGTSSVKALLIDAEQRTVADASVPLSLSRPQPLWSEQNADDWVDAVAAGVAALRKSAPEAFARLAGVGLSGQMHGATFLDAAGKPLQAGDPVERRALVRRMHGNGKARPRPAPPRRQHRHAGLHRAEGVVGGATHEPKVFAATKRILLPKDYVRLKLTGEAVSEMSDAAGTLWLDVGKRRWDDELLAATGLNVSHMPSLVEGSEVSAYLSPEIAAAWGLAGKRIPVAGGAGDNAAAAVGVGATAPGAGFVSIGTSGVVFSVTDRFVCLPERTLHAFCHALPNRWHGMAVNLSAAAALTWIAELMARGDDVGGCVAEAEAFAKSAKAVETAPVFLPYLSGERTPHNDANATGVFAGLRAEHEAAALIYAVLEGVAFNFADGVDVLTEAGARPKATMLVGGGARSALWGQLIADATGLTIDLAAGAEAGAALGAARLAMLAAGAGDEASVCRRPPTQRVFTPDAARAALLAPRLKRYRALYPAEKGAR